MIDADELFVRYLGGELSPDEERGLEERLFDGRLDGADLDWLPAATLAMRRAAIRGTLDGTLLPGDLERIHAEGHRLLRVELAAGATTDVDLSPDFDLMVTRVPADLRGVRRVDMEGRDPDGRLLKRVEAVRFSTEQGGVVMCCERELAVASGQVMPLIFVHVLAVEETGDRELGVYGMRTVNLPPDVG